MNTISNNNKQTEPQQLLWQKARKNMTDEEAYRLIGERATELSKREYVQKKMVEIANKDGKAEAEKWLYRMAIATLM